MADVARLAGVSHQTVSRVINGHPSLRPATRERVEEAIRQLGYRPNTVARALVTRRSGTIGVIGTKGGFWGPSTVHRTIQAAARESGYFVSSVNLPDVTREDLAAAVEHLRDQQRRGHRDDRRQRRGARHRPRTRRPAACPSWSSRATSPGARGPSASTRSPAPGWRPSTSSSLGHANVDARRRPPALGRGPRPARRLAGPPSTPRASSPSSRCSGDWTAASGYAAGVAGPATPTSPRSSSANDHMAIGVLRALSEAGRSRARRTSASSASTTSPSRAS